MSPTDLPDPDATASPDPADLADLIPAAPAPDPGATAETGPAAAPAPDRVTAEHDPAPIAAPTQAPDGFAALGLAPGILATLESLGYEEPTPIQRAAIPPILAGRDILGEAPTGTGKTAAFSLPLLQRLFGARPGPAPRGQVRGLVIVPTRELAMQVAEALHRYGASLGVRILAIYGGAPIGRQLHALERGVEIVVATPGRAVDHLRRGSLRLGSVELVVLDEADEMLDLGFAEDLEAILGELPDGHGTALFSATVSPEIGAIARRHLTDPVMVRVGMPGAGKSAPAATIRQVAYVVRGVDKLAALCRILDVEDPTSALVFGRTRGEVDELAERLADRGHEVAALHGGMAQDQRDRVMGRFREGGLEILVATDVAARGLDVEHVSHVVNYDIPTDTDAYTHRIGRTGRAGRSGVAITLLEPREHRLLRQIERATGGRVELGVVPTVADVRERRLELLRGSLREALLREGSDRYRAVVEPLAEEFDIVEIALAAVALAAQAAGGETDEREIPTLRIDEASPRGAARKPPPFPAPRPGGAPRPTGPRPPGPGWERSGLGHPGWTRLRFGGGRRIGMRPSDLVGAIANGAGVPAAAIGAIVIEDAWSLVDVREDVAELVIGALAGAKIRGRVLPIERIAAGGDHRPPNGPAPRRPPPPRRTPPPWTGPKPRRPASGPPPREGGPRP